MLLADLGAEVVVVDRKGGSLPFNAKPKYDITRRGKRSIALDLKQPARPRWCCGCSRARMHCSRDSARA